MNIRTTPPNTPHTTPSHTLSVLTDYYLNPQDEGSIRELLACSIGGATGQGAYSSNDARGHLLVTFNVRHQGRHYAFRVSVEGYAFLLTVTVLGYGLRVNLRAKDIGSPHLKFAMADALTVARVLTGRLDGENAAFLNGNTCDLAPSNLIEGRDHKGTKRGPIEAYAAFLSPPPTNDYASPFVGSPKEQFEERKQLLHDALETLHSAYPYA